MSMDARVDALRWRELPESWCSAADGEVCALRSVGADVSGYESQRGLKAVASAEDQLMNAIFLIAI
jgi:hypothetical protein